MKILVVSRLFSGFAKPLREGQWPPAGAPAIYKLLEGLADDPEVELSVIFTAKDAETSERLGTERRKIAVPRLGIEAYVLDYRQSSALREGWHTAVILSHILRAKPDLVYFTNANLVVASIAARLRLAKTVLRFMGLFPHEKRVADGGGRALVRWLYRAPFSLALCTEEGSGGAVYLPRLLRSGVPLEVILNGVDKPERKTTRAELLARYDLPEARPVVLFVGRLEFYKGAREFADGMLDLLRKTPDACTAVVVGEGTFRTDLEQISSLIEADGGIFRLIGGIPHDEVLDWYRFSDIYVSLNMHGNLSNANLEAIACGVCLILPESDPKSSTDVITDSLIPDDAAIRLPRNDLPAALSRALRELLSSKARQEALRSALRQAAPAIIRTWNARIGYEIGRLKELSSGA
ncbi:MAG: glycosyltransferase [Alphaproteobacteria bacterium]|nr:glycosyltransferase [Alphaproteobacteria bacterium]